MISRSEVATAGLVAYGAVLSRAGLFGVDDPKQRLTLVEILIAAGFTAVGLATADGNLASAAAAAAGGVGGNLVAPLVQ